MTGRALAAESSATAGKPVAARRPSVAGKPPVAGTSARAGKPVAARKPFALLMAALLLGVLFPSSLVAAYADLQPEGSEGAGVGIADNEGAGTQAAGTGDASNGGAGDQAEADMGDGIAMGIADTSGAGYKLETASDFNGTITPTIVGIASGEDREIIATAAQGYVIKEFLVDEEPVPEAEGLETFTQAFE
ncbi:MAG: hypothetical protein LBG81_00505, partial [Coriobacteriaceae bacterium]|nr:hypothetical protein [Coriobacteriaceae bacterium]